MVPKSEKQKFGQYFTPTTLTYLVSLSALRTRNQIVYDPTSGKRFDLPRKGFRVKYNNKYGFADAYGIHFDEETSNNLTSGLTIVREDDDPVLNGKEYSTYFLGGK